MLHLNNNQNVILQYTNIGDQATVSFIIQGYTDDFQTVLLITHKDQILKKVYKSKVISFVYTLDRQSSIQIHLPPLIAVTVHFKIMISCLSIYKKISCQLQTVEQGGNHLLLTKFGECQTREIFQIQPMKYEITRIIKGGFFTRARYARQLINYFLDIKPFDATFEMFHDFYDGKYQNVTVTILRRGTFSYNTVKETCKYDGKFPLESIYIDFKISIF